MVVVAAGAPAEVSPSWPNASTVRVPGAGRRHRVDRIDPVAGDTKRLHPGTAVAFDTERGRHQRHASHQRRHERTFMLGTQTSSYTSKCHDSDDSLALRPARDIGCCLCNTPRRHAGSVRSNQRAAFRTGRCSCTTNECFCRPRRCTSRAGGVEDHRVSRRSDRHPIRLGPARYEGLRV